MNDYQNFIRLSRYARWTGDRRETWAETVARYFAFFEEQLGLRAEDNQELYAAVRSMDVLPSMRALWTAGPALARDHMAAYNCTYTPIDSPRAWDEMLYILMCGTGVGFSVERQNISQLPPVPDALHPTDTTVTVRDSKIGWAVALKELISLLYAGLVPTWDLSRIRPAGAKLRTFGGTASGSQCLEDLFRFVVHTFRAATGRRLNSLECHDICCKIGECVVVGGVRRAALLSLSNLSDPRMRDAKSGEWWNTAPWRAFANNSVAYTEKPDVGAFMEEWLALYRSKSGERGLFSRVAAAKAAGRSGRRALKWDNGDAIQWGTNPSLAAGTKVLTTEGIFNIEDLEGLKFQTYALGGTTTSSTCWMSSPAAPIYELCLQGGKKIYTTAEHKWPVVTRAGYTKKRTDCLQRGDRLPLEARSSLGFGKLGTEDDGFLVGWNLGDGWRSRGGKQLGFMTQSTDPRERLTNILRGLSWTGEWGERGEINVCNKRVSALFTSLGVGHKRDGLPGATWRTGSDAFRKGLVDGLFSADGCVTAAGITYVSAHKQLAEDVLELLGFYGIKASILCRRAKSSFPNGKDYGKTYTSYRVRIRNKAHVVHFREVFNLTHESKRAKLAAISVRNKHTPATVKVIGVSLTDRVEPVWDINVHDTTHCFKIAHCTTGNCSEIILRPNECCNLTNIIARAGDSVEDLERKAKVAATLGTWQSTLTSFRYVRRSWQRNCDEERLLGVGLAGIMDCGALNHRSAETRDLLEHLREIVRVTNVDWAERLGINPSPANTCVKPDGNSSQLVDASSGIHPRYAPFYIRRVRQSTRDPLTRFMQDAGFVWEKDVAVGDHVVFSFPQRAPAGALTRHDLSATDHLEHWLMFQRHWTEHKVSITVQVQEDEWPRVGAWVYDNFDEMAGVSFLPSDGHTYMQAPYEEISETQYTDMLAVQPEDVDWSGLSSYEQEDNTVGAQTLACTANQCEI